MKVANPLSICKPPPSTPLQQFPRYALLDNMVPDKSCRRWRKEEGVSERVLEVDGIGAYVSLAGLEEVAVEAWVKCQGLVSYGEVWGFGASWRVVGINNDGDMRDLQFFISNSLFLVRM